MNETAVVYLARRKSGIDALRRFLASYESHKAGHDHDLIIVFKGFKEGAEITEWRTDLSLFKTQEIHMRDFGYDVRAYSLAARRLPHRCLCFLNSFSEIVADNWLRILHGHACRPGVGVVGCTGAWTSISSIVEQERRELDRLALFRRLLYQLKVPVNRQGFPPFPNPHVRSNAFLIERKTMNRFWPRFALCKRNAYLWESGRDGFTRCVKALNLQVLVAGKDGYAYGPGRWNRNGVFLQGKQENLLVSDNQTRAYDSASEAKRRQLSVYAWGEDLTKQTI